MDVSPMVVDSYIELRRVKWTVERSVTESITRLSHFDPPSLYWPLERRLRGVIYLRLRP